MWNGYEVRKGLLGPNTKIRQIMKGTGRSKVQRRQWTDGRVCAFSPLKAAPATEVGTIGRAAVMQDSSGLCRIDFGGYQTIVHVSFTHELSHLHLWLGVRCLPCCGEACQLGRVTWDEITSGSLFFL